MQKELNFSVEEIKRIEFSDYNDKEYSIARIGFISTRPNSHEIGIDEECLRKSAPSVLGSWLVAKVWAGDAMAHEADEQIVGLVPKEQEVEFVEDEDGYLRAYCDAVMSKRYASEFCQIFEKDDNTRAVSIEATFTMADEDNAESFDIKGVTVIGKAYKPSCPESDITVIRFSDDTQKTEEYYTNVWSQLQKFAETRKQSMTYKIDKSKESLSDKAWGDVDKAKMRDKIMEAENRTELVKAVYMLVEDGWEDAPSEHLKYPVMELKGDTFVYNRDALASALGYAKKEDETTVVDKIEKIYKKLELDETDGKEEKMEETKEIEFSAVDIGDMWGRIWSVIDEHKEWDYSVQGIYEEDNQKFAILCDRDKNLYRLDFSLTEDGLVASDEIVEVKQEFVETDTVKKFAEPENIADYRFAEEDKKDEGPDDESEDKGDEDGEKKMSEDEMMAKIDQLSKDIEERDHIIMKKDSELEELRAYKAAVVAKEMACRVDEVMGEIRNYVNDEQFATFKAEGLACCENDIDAWSNKVKAVCFNAVKQNIKKDDKGVFSFAMPKVIKHSDPNSIWEKLENK